MESHSAALGILETSQSGARTVLVLWINMMSIKAEADGTQIHCHHSSLWEFFSAALNIRIELKILRAGPSLMLIIFTMSVWVISKNASPSICWNKGRKKPDTKEYGLTRCIVVGLSKALCCTITWLHNYAKKTYTRDHEHNIPNLWVSTYPTK